MCSDCHFSNSEEMSDCFVEDLMAIENVDYLMENYINETTPFSPLLWSKTSAHGCGTNKKRI